MASNGFQEWDQQCNDINSDKQKLLEQMKANLQTEESAEVLYRLAKVCVLLAKSAEKAKNKDLERAMAVDALSYADKACKKDPNSSECHKWYCAAAGKMANISASKDKIRYGKEFKDHADISLKLNPNDQFMQSMYGQWCYNVASLSWLERRVATAVYGTLPNADYDMALNAFKKVNELDPQSKENHLWMAKVLIAKKQTTEAKQYIQKGLTLKNKTVSDEICHQELEALNKKYK